VLIMRALTDVAKAVVMVCILFALLLFLFGVQQAYADELPTGPVAKMKNVNQGHIYLTLEPCSVKSELPISEAIYRAYAVDFEGTGHEQVTEACWVSPAIDYSKIPEEERGRVRRAVTILAPDGFYSYLVSDFEPVNRPEEVTGEL
jgi:hypothetical protein